MTNLIRRNHDSRGFATNENTRPNHIWDAFRMMDALLGADSSRQGARSSGEVTLSPPFDVEEVKDAYVLKADLPGLTESDVDVTVMGNAITISGKREPEPEPEGQRYYTLERGYGAFSRTFGLPDGASLDDLTANLENGVLTVRVPKRPEVQPRRISLRKPEAGS